MSGGTLIGSLNVELVLEVLEWLQNDCPKCLLNVARTSKALRVLAEPFIYRTISLDFRGRGHQILDRLAHDEKAWANAQTIRVVPPDEERNWSKNVPLLCSLVRKSVRLRKFRWETGIFLTDADLLEELSAKRPLIHFEYKTTGRFHTWEALEKLRNNVNLTSLELWLSKDAAESFEELPRVAYSCPNLRKLEITVNDGEPGSEPEWRCENSKLLQLNALKLQNLRYPFTNGPPLHEMTDPTLLKTLSLTDILNVPIFNFGNLTALTLGRKESPLASSLFFGQVHHLLLACDNLRDVDLTGMTQSVDEEVFQHLGSKLKSFRLHEYESIEGIQKRLVLSAGQFADLGKYCINLERLSIDISYKDQWPYTIFDQISRCLWFLKTLELNLEIGIADPNHPLKPAATFSNVQHIWQHIWTVMRIAHRETTHLRQLNIVAGSFRTLHPRNLSEKLIWEVSQQQRFNATISSDPAERKLGVANIVSLELQELVNGTQKAGEYSTSGRNTIRRAESGPQYDPESFDSWFYFEMPLSAPFPD